MEDYVSLTPHQIELLSAKLDVRNVASRKQGSGFQVSYIEGWHAIAEANRIFGFDSWDRETVAMIQLEPAREFDGKWRVAYMARVKITVRHVYSGETGTTI